MMMSPTTLCLQHVLQCARKFHTMSVNAASAQRGELACISKAKVGICQGLGQCKEHTASLLKV